MNIPEEMLTAYVDGELCAEDRARVEAAMRADAGIARRIEQHRSLRKDLRAAFDGVLREPVPERLLTAARSSGGDAAGASRATVADFAAAAEVRQSKGAARGQRRWSWPEWGAIAASLVIGVIGTRFAIRPPEAAFTSQQGRLVAQGHLADVLSHRLASTQPRAAATRVGVSFRARSGAYCRSFTVTDGEALAGLACREGDGWRIDVLARADAASGDYSQAGTALPAAVVSAVEQQIDGEPLDAASEERARRSGWQDIAAQ